MKKAGYKTGIGCLFSSVFVRYISVRNTEAKEPLLCTQGERGTVYGRLSGILIVAYYNQSKDVYKIYCRSDTPAIHFCQVHTSIFSLSFEALLMPKCAFLKEKNNFLISDYSSLK
jgi:hypothetical protein